MSSKEGLSILDAVENLNKLVDADSLGEIEVTEDSLLISHKGEEAGGLREIYWVHAGSSDEQTYEVIKETFRSLLEHLQTSYQNQIKGGRDTKHFAEGVSTIMVLVGETTEKLNRFGTLFKDRITHLTEYKDLQDFYRNKVIKETFIEFIKKPISKERVELVKEEVLEKELQELLGEKEKVQEISGVHILNDLEVIKRDHLYELFYLKNEAGHNFYTYHLARNIKVACNFGEYAKEYFGDDPLLQLKNWEDKELHLRARQILKVCNRKIERFYREAMKHKGMDVVVSLHNALMALMLASNPRNLIRQFSLKGCQFYFSDFLVFLR